MALATLKLAQFILINMPVTFVYVLIKYIINHFCKIMKMIEGGLGP
jgi:hypothetical protein